MILKMKEKNYLTLGKEFLKYCELNEIKDIESFASQVFNRGFTIIKFGETPVGFKSEPTVVEKEVVKEVIKEVPVEVVKEIVKQVPVEVIVEKEVYITDDKEVKKLAKEISKLKEDNKSLKSKKGDEVTSLIEENEKLKSELEKIKKSLEAFSPNKRGKYMKGSDLSSLYDE